jgi:RNA polymerase sigma-70 factor (ECF subfamily)
MEEHHSAEAPGAAPGEREWLRSALLTDQDGVLTATRRRLARIAHARGMDPQVIDDVVQETLLEAWSHLDRLRSVAGFHPWVDEICRNVCRRVNRRRGQDTLHHAPARYVTGALDDTASPENDDALVDLPAPASCDPFEELCQRDLTSLLDRAVETLPLATRQAIELSYLIDLPRAEVAARLHLSQGALDTRLHRARTQLRQALNGPLRAEAEAYDLALDEVPLGQWRATRMWCPHCAQRRLEGYFVQAEGATGPNLHLRCPDCARREGRDTAHSMGMVSLAGLRSFRPAWKRVMQGMSERITQALAGDGHRCFWCGRQALLTVQAASATTPSSAPAYWIRAECAYCGVEGDTGHDSCLPSVDQLLYWSDPRARQFLLSHPRCLTSLGPEIERDGAVALTLQLADLDGADRLTVVARRETLHILVVD